MPKANPQAAIVRYFETEFLGVAEVVFNIVRDVMKRRRQTEAAIASPPEAKKKKKRGRPKQTALLFEPPTDIEAAG